MSWAKQTRGAARISPSGRGQSPTSPGASCQMWQHQLDVRLYVHATSTCTTHMVFVENLNSKSSSRWQKRKLFSQIATCPPWVSCGSFNLVLARLIWSQMYTHVAGATCCSFGVTGTRRSSESQLSSGEPTCQMRQDMHESLPAVLQQSVASSLGRKNVICELWEQRPCDNVDT